MLEIGPGAGRSVGRSYRAPVGADGGPVLVIGSAVPIRAGVIAHDRISGGSKNTRAEILSGNIAIDAARTAEIVKARAAI